MIHTKTSNKHFFIKITLESSLTSYCGVMDISTILANSVSKQYENENLICPAPFIGAYLLLVVLVTLITVKKHCCPRFI